jgi:hypothetical protein
MLLIGLDLLLARFFHFRGRSTAVFDLLVGHALPHQLTVCLVGRAVGESSAIACEPANARPSIVSGARLRFIMKTSADIAYREIELCDDSRAKITLPRRCTATAPSYPS